MTCIDKRMIRLVSVLLALWLLPVSSALGQTYRVTEMNTEQLRALDRNRTVVLLPGGILEEHGPYLPSFSDGYANERFTEELADAISERPGWNALVFPQIPLGSGGANEIGRKYVFDGTYAIRSTVLRAVFMDLATALGEAGFQWIFVVHGHGAPTHNRALDQAGDYFHDTYGGRMVHLAGLIPILGAADAPSETLSEQARKDDGFAVHAGLGEHSRNLHLRPDLVNPAYRSARDYTGTDWESLVEIAREADWPGYFGAPRHASAAFGARVWEARSTAAIDLALKILDGLDPTEIPRLGAVARSVPANVAIDTDALARDAEIEDRQRAWLTQNGLE